MMVAVVRKPGQRWALSQLERFARLCGGGAPLVALAAGCHPRRGLEARYSPSTAGLRLYCRVCGRFMVEIAVGGDGRAN